MRLQSFCSVGHMLLAGHDEAHPRQAQTLYSCRACVTSTPETPISQSPNLHLGLDRIVAPAPSLQSTASCHLVSFCMIQRAASACSIRVLSGNLAAGTCAGPLKKKATTKARKQDTCRLGSKNNAYTSMRMRRIPWRKNVRLYSIMPRRASHVSVWRSTTSARCLLVSTSCGLRRESSLSGSFQVAKGAVDLDALLRYLRSKLPQGEGTVRHQPRVLGHPRCLRVLFAPPPVL